MSNPAVVVLPSSSTNGVEPSGATASPMLKGWDIIERITPFVHAVGRVVDDGGGGRGSAILLSLPERTPPFFPREERGAGTFAVLLSTSEVLPNLPGDLAGRCVRFMEQPVVGTAIAWGWEPAAFSVALRGDVGIVSSMEAGISAAAADDAVDEIGYTLTYCEIASGSGSIGRWDPSDPLGGRAYGAGMAPQRGSHGGEDLRPIQPLPLPLCLSSVPPVRIGDTHLLVTHVDGLERHYVVRSVVAVYEDYCEYALDSGRPRLGEFASGGAVFNERGDFIGLQHHRNESICMFVASIVRHLFDSDHLGMCRLPISEPPLAIEDSSGDGLLDSSLTQTRSAPLTAHTPSYLEVYDEFMTGYDSLLHMLSAFWYAPSLTQKVLEVMVSPSYERELRTAVSSRVVGIVLGIIDAHPHLEPLVNIALVVLCRLCVYDHNLHVFIHVGGISTVMEVLKEYLHQPRVLQWGVYCLLRLVDERASIEHRATSVNLILQCSFLEFSMNALREHARFETAHMHLVSWISLLLANLIDMQPRVVTWLVQKDFIALWIDLLRTYLEEDAVLRALLLVLKSVFKRVSGSPEPFSGIGKSYSSAEQGISKHESEPLSNEVPLEGASEGASLSRGADSCPTSAFPLHDGSTTTEIFYTLDTSDSLSVNTFLLYASLSKQSCRDALLDILVCVLEREAAGLCNHETLSSTDIALEILKHVRSLGLLAPTKNGNAESQSVFDIVMMRLDIALLQLQKKLPTSDALLKNIECAHLNITA
ncbi:unnamed protein product [Phytomonas sp. EM1]|nr:unnamed protein product [Phytomonas sp. EM1]|eukprot:CCW64119.1 unnamed protein product [Phytomonas sp. isolate EM1]